MQCLVPVAPDSSSYRVWFFKIRVYLGGPVAPNCTINKTKSSSSCLQLELVLFYYLYSGIPELSPDSTMLILLDPGHGFNTLVNCLYQAATKNFPGKRIRTDYSDNDPDWEENFYLLRKTLCVAILSENYYMDNKSDLEYLQSRVGKQAIIDTHVEGITEYLNLIQYII